MYTYNHINLLSFLKYRTIDFYAPNLGPVFTKKNEMMHFQKIVLFICKTGPNSHSNVLRWHKDRDLPLLYYVLNLKNQYNAKCSVVV